MEKISLRTARAISNLTLKKASELSGISTRTIRNWETDTKALEKADLRKVISLCRVYGISIDNI